MSFGFGFKNDDIDDDIAIEVQSSSLEGARPAGLSPETDEPHFHDLKDLLNALPSRISYSALNINGHDGVPIRIPRRELFDVKAQLMAEDQPTEQSLIAGLLSDDIKPNVYEGGFKTWECSIDLAEYADKMLHKQSKASEATKHYVELGAGTGLPSLVLFHYYLKFQPSFWKAVHLCVADYNLSVLETTTVPNFLLVWYFASSSVTPADEGDLEITQSLLSNFLNDLSSKAISLSAISGSWGNSFCTLLTQLENYNPQENVEIVLLASETIYSLSSIHPFTEVLMKVLKIAEISGGRAKALVAAKRVYFGVGGGVDDFLGVLEENHGQAILAWESSGSGVQRVIFEATLP